MSSPRRVVAARSSPSSSSRHARLPLPAPSCRRAVGARLRGRFRSSSLLASSGRPAVRVAVSLLAAPPARCVLLARALASFGLRESGVRATPFHCLSACASRFTFSSGAFQIGIPAHMSSFNADTTAYILQRFETFPQRKRRSEEHKPNIKNKEQEKIKP